MLFHIKLTVTSHFSGQDLAFLVGNKTAFELPLQFVANSNIAGRTEVSLEFQPQNPTKSKPSKYAPDEMAEIRFYVPGTQAKGSRSDGGSQKSDAEDEGEEISAAQAFHNTIKERAEIGQATGDIILSFEEVLVLTPRGRYDVDLYHDFFRLRGKTYDYKIVYSTILKLFLLPKDDLHVLFIVSPLRGSRRFLALITSDSLSDGSGYSDPAGSNEVSVPRDAVHQGRGDHCRAESDRVCSSFSITSIRVCYNSVLAARRLKLMTE